MNKRDNLHDVCGANFSDNILTDRERVPKNEAGQISLTRPCTQADRNPGTGPGIRYLLQSPAMAPQ
jgi:hypothetical protein